MILFRETSIKHWSWMRNEQANLRTLIPAGQASSGSHGCWMETRKQRQIWMVQLGPASRKDWCGGAQEEADKSFSVHADEHGGWSSLSGSL